MKRLLLIATTALLVIGCGKERYAEINTDPNAVSKPDPSYLFLNAQNALKGDEYILQFYTANRYTNRWAQMSVGWQDAGLPTLNTSTMTELEDNRNPTLGTFYRVGGFANQIAFVLDNMDEESRLSYEYLRQMAKAMSVFAAIYATDYNGDIPYSEALVGLYTNPPLLRPKYDTQEELLNMLDTDLANAVKILSNPVKNSKGEDVTQVVVKPTQELVFGGKYDKWVVFINSIRLRLASRLVYANPDKAKTIAQEVATDGRYMKKNSDDYRYVSDKYGRGYNGIWEGTASKGFVDYLKANRDPRLRVFFYKNKMNSYTIQGFLDQEKPMPDYIADQVVLSADGKKFIRWKSAEDGDGDQYMGEPWVRYQGIPAKYKNFMTQAEVDQYVTMDKCNLEVGNNKRYINPVSGVNMALFHTNLTYDYPSMKVALDQYKPDNGYNYSVVMLGSAEVNLTLSMFVLRYGISVPGETANSLFQKGIESSVLAYDETAKKHNILYYEKEYDETTYKNGEGKDVPVAKPVKLQEDEIPNMLLKDAHILNGTPIENLEKVYIQLLINSYQYPFDVFPIIKLGGVPMYGSNVWPRELYTETLANDNALNIPRRFLVSFPDKASINYTNYMEALTRQGFTDFGTSSPSKSERYWYDDKGSPEYGTGPKL